MTIHKHLTLDAYTESIHGGDRDRMQDIYEDDYDVALSVNVINARRTRGYTQTILAKALGTQQPNIARFESGAALPSHEMIKKIARVLGLRPIAPGFVEEPATSGATVMQFSLKALSTWSPSIDIRSTSFEPQYAYAK